MGVRSKFTQYRLGTGTGPTLSPGFLTIFNPSLGAAQTVAPGQIVQNVSGYIDFARAADLRTGDVLKHQASSRLFLVLQVEQKPILRRAIVAEIAIPVPDEFESGVIEAYWTQSGTWVIDVSFVTIVTGSQLSQTTPLNAPQLQQLVSGNFDCFVQLSADQGAGGAVRFCLLKAQNVANTLCVTVGITDAGANAARFIRQDRNGSGLFETQGPLIDPVHRGWVRLRRDGIHFRTFYGFNPAQPTNELDWAEIVPTSQWASDVDVNVGPSGYRNTGNTADLRFYTFQNWPTAVRLL